MKKFYSFLSMLFLFVNIKAQYICIRDKPADYHYVCAGVSTEFNLKDMPSTATEITWSFEGFTAVAESNYGNYVQTASWSIYTNSSSAYGPQRVKVTYKDGGASKVLYFEVKLVQNDAFNLTFSDNTGNLDGINNPFNACSGVNKQITIKVNNATSDNPYSSFSKFTVLGPNNYTVVGDKININSNIIGENTYTVTTSEDHCNYPISQNFKVKVNPIPNIPTITTSIVNPCLNSSFNLTALSSGSGTPPFNYVWTSTSATSTFAPNTPDKSIINSTISSSSSTTDYTVKAIDKIGCESAVATKRVAPANFNLTSPNQTICLGYSGNIVANIVQIGSTTQTFSSPSISPATNIISSSGNATSQTYSVNPQKKLTYTVSLNMNNACILSKSIEMDVLKKPVIIDFAGNPFETCVSHLIGITPPKYNNIVGGGFNMFIDDNSDTKKTQTDITIINPSTGLMIDNRDYAMYHNNQNKSIIYDNIYGYTFNLINVNSAAADKYYSIGFKCNSSNMCGSSTITHNVNIHSKSPQNIIPPTPYYFDNGVQLTTTVNSPDDGYAYRYVSDNTNEWSITPNTAFTTPLSTAYPTSDRLYPELKPNFSGYITAKARQRNSCGAGPWSSENKLLVLNGQPSSCTSDIYEPNNTIATATWVQSNYSLNGITATTADVDYYAIVTTASSPNIKIQLNNRISTCQLLDANGNVLVSGLNTYSFLKYNTTVPGTYYIKVGGPQSSLCYKLFIYTGSAPFRIENDSDDETISSMFSVSPNPVGSTAELNYTIQSAGDVTIEVFDINGSKVLKENKGYNDIGSFNNMINTSGFKSGIYMVFVKKDGEVIGSSKFVKE